MAKTRVDIILDFFDTGRTTFIKKLFVEALSNEKVVLIESGLGEIDVDGGFLKDSGIEVREMNSGCICCSFADDFANSLKEILTKYVPDRIIIESPDIGKLLDVTYTVADVEEELSAAGNSAVILVDVKKAKLYIKNFGEFLNNQVQHAKIIVLPRADVTDQRKIDEAIQLIREISKGATIITMLTSDLTGEKLSETLEHPVGLKIGLLEELAEEHGHHHHDEEYEHCCYRDEEEYEYYRHHNEEHRHRCHHDEEEYKHHHHHDEEHEHCCHHDEEEHEHHRHHDEDGHCCRDHDHRHHHHSHDADGVLDSAGLENVPAFTEDKLHAPSLGLVESEESDKAVRVKGMVPSVDSDAQFHFDLVPGGTEIRRGAVEASSKVCVTGSELKGEAIAGESKAQAMVEQSEREEERTPVSMINSSLEAGKIQFLCFTMRQFYFQTEDKVLFLVCEGGEGEYPEAPLEKYNTTAVHFESQGECTKEVLRVLSEESHSERVLIR